MGREEDGWEGKVELVVGVVGVGESGEKVRRERKRKGRVENWG